MGASLCPECSILIQFPVYDVEDDPSLCDSAPHKTRKKLLASEQLGFGHGGHMGSK